MQQSLWHYVIMAGHITNQYLKPARELRFVFNGQCDLEVDQQ